MKTKIFSEATDNFSIQLDEDIIRKIYQLCKKSYPNETGGILIGKYSDNLKSAYIYTITDAPEDSKMGKTWFKRGVKGLQELLDYHWDNGQQYYLGEWHYHPNGTPVPSNIDIKEMNKISKNKKYNCPEPILIISSNKKDNWNLGLYIFKNGMNFIQTYQV